MRNRNYDGLKKEVEGWKRPKCGTRRTWWKQNSGLYKNTKQGHDFSDLNKTGIWTECEKHKGLLIKNKISEMWRPCQKANLMKCNNKGKNFIAKLSWPALHDRATWWILWQRSQVFLDQDKIHIHGIKTHQCHVSYWLFQTINLHISPN